MEAPGDVTPSTHTPLSEPPKLPQVPQESASGRDLLDPCKGEGKEHCVLKSPERSPSPQVQAEERMSMGGGLNPACHPPLLAYPPPKSGGPLSFAPLSPILLSAWELGRQTGKHP